MLSSKKRIELVENVTKTIREFGFSLPGESQQTTINNKLLFASTNENEAFNPAENAIYDASFDVYMTKTVLRVPLLLDIDDMALLYFTIMNR